MPSIAELGRRAKAASRVLATAGTDVKDAALLAAADLLVERGADLLRANDDDIARAEASGTSRTVVDRLRLTGSRIDAMAGGLRGVAALADPVGEVTDGWVRPNGLRVERVLVPLGVVAIVYENRPNVTSDAFGLCLKSGNAAFLRGSSGAISSNTAIATVLREGLTKVGLPEDALVLVEDTRHEAAVEFMRLRDCIDVLIPRGGPSLIQAVLDNATVPYVIDGDGNCHVYVDASADLDMARRIVVNAKTQRPSVCNAAETLLVHEAVAERFLPDLAAELGGVELRADDRARQLLPGALAATDDDWRTEFLDLVLAVRVVPSLDAAIEHVTRFGSGHSEAIVTTDLAAADRWVREVDAAAVLVNASTRFIDGEELGFGAEIGISTQKLHARGPMGLRELTTRKFVVRATAMSEAEQQLEGGIANAGAVVRVGEHVLRPSSARTPAIHALLRHVRANGFDGVPEPLGVDPDGRERFTYVEGDVAVPPYPAWAQADGALGSVAALLRRYHDAADGFGGEWPWSTEMADPLGGPIICHNDVCLENVVFRDGTAVALLDFEFAAPGRPEHDLAALARMCVPFDPDSSIFGWAPNDAAARLRVVADGYGLDAGGRAAFLDCLSDQVERGGEFVARRVAAGEAAFVAMWEAGGGMARFDRRRAWFREERAQLENALA